MFFSLCFEREEQQKPYLLYHGMLSMHVLPCAGAGGLDDSSLAADQAVDKDEIAQVMCALAACAEGTISAILPEGW